MQKQPNQGGLAGLTDRTPRYTVKEMAEKMGLTPYAVRYYDNEGLIPYVERTVGNSRRFSDYNLAWLKIVHCLRSTGLPVSEVRRYIEMCREGDSTIPERAAMIHAQERKLREQLDELNRQMEILEYKKRYYEGLMAGKEPDNCNPMNLQRRDDAPGRGR
ncbi:MAG: MerR family transcriptional regulator [Oligosphaeraceae bacterium]